MESHGLRNDRIGPFGVAETRRRIQKQGGHCLSQASLPAAEFGEQRRHLPHHAEGQWFWVLLPKQKDLGCRDETPALAKRVFFEIICGRRNLIFFFPLAT
ncbi:MAG TPA: hypothetical protein PKK23_20050, partial [Nitrospirales bacterium]|nr:hypothetical protein [Nitrospirales bacterium]